MFKNCEGTEKDIRSNYDRNWKVMDLGRNTLLNFQEVLGWFEMGLKWTI